MKISFAIALAIATTAGPTLAYPQARGSKAPSSGWVVMKNTDPMTDEVSQTLVLWAADRQSSLRVNCNNRDAYVVLLTLPKGIEVTNPTMAEFRFDTEPRRACSWSRSTSRP
jgi:hypothetical protein